MATKERFSRNSENEVLKIVRSLSARSPSGEQKLTYTVPLNNFCILFVYSYTILGFCMLYLAIPSEPSFRSRSFSCHVRFHSEHEN